MTLVFTDLVGSTQLKEELGNVEGIRLIHEHQRLLRSLLGEFPSAFEVNTAGDSFFLAFPNPTDAVCFALRLQSRLRDWNRRRSVKLMERVGIHTGQVTVEVDEQGKVRDLQGLEVDKCARVMSLGRENHILLTRFAYDNARGTLKGQAIPEVGEVQWASHGGYRLKGVVEPVEVCEVAERGFTTLEPPPDSDKARRVAPVAEADTTPEVPRGWRRWLTGELVSRRASRFGAVLACLLGTLALIPPLGHVLAGLSYDVAHLFRRFEKRPEAVIVRMDQDSRDGLRQPTADRWDRRLHADLIERMGTAHARAVVFDLFFHQPVDPGQDRRLHEAACRFGRVAVGALVQRAVLSGQPTMQYNLPFPDLAACTQWGTTYFRDSGDAVARELLLHVGEIENLGVVVARMLGTDPSPRERSVWLNYYGPPGTPFDSVSYTAALTNELTTTTFSNKVVFVGSAYEVKLPGEHGEDYRATPYTRWDGKKSPGVEILATATLNLMRGEWLRRLPSWLELILILTVGVCAGYGLSRFRPLPAAVLATIAGTVFAAAAIALVWRAHIWFSWLIICSVQLPAALAWATLAWANAQRGTAVARAIPGQAAGPPRAIPGPTPGPAGAQRSQPEGPMVPAIPNYQLLREIGRGSYGRVWLATDAIGLLRAVKVVQRSSFEDRVPYEREFSGIRRFTPVSLEHPGLIRVLHVGRDDAAGHFYYVMEAADDEKSGADINPEAYSPRTLASVLRLQPRGFLPAADVIELGAILAEALGFLHGHRLIHRDIKPANILYVRGQPRLADIGLVTAMAETGQDVTYLGTEGYIAPEGPGSAAADLYSLGKSLYVAATGCDPSDFPETSPTLDQRPDQSLLLALKSLWVKACAPRPAERFDSAAELTRELRRLSVPPKTGNDPSSARETSA